MQTQNYKNHSRFVPLYHYVTLSLLLAVIIGSFINVYHTNLRGESIYSASLICVLSIVTTFIGLFARSFALKAQDRAIRAEENFRHFIATGKPLDSRLKLSQIIALRFAGDDEFVALAKKAADENTGVNEIKMAIANWKGDYDRV